MKQKIPVLVSACLLGMNCRYNGEVKEKKEIKALLEVEGLCLIPICPEQMGGLPTPRYPSEKSGANVVNEIGEDVTEYYQRGAQEALKMAEMYQCKYAILKERSPSCGNREVYDGTFSRTLVSGEGVAAEFLRENGISIFGESEIGDFFEQLIGDLTAEAGFCEFKLVPAENLLFERNVRLLCEQECMEHKIHSWSLPPAVGSFEECFRKCRSYQKALLVSSISLTDDIMNFDAWMEAGQEMNAMILGLSERFRELQMNVLSLGMRCRRCETCAYPKSPCRHPQTLLPATEGYGIHIMNTMEAEGITGYYDNQTIVCFGVILIDFKENLRLF